MSWLKEMMEKATPRPWILMQDGTVQNDKGEVFMGYPRDIDEEYNPDTVFKVALANHSEAFQQLWDAANREVTACSGMNDCNGTHCCDLARAVEELRELCG